MANKPETIALPPYSHPLPPKMANQPETIIEERHEQLMVSPKGGNPTSKIAHFVNPTLNSTDLTPVLPSIPLPLRPTLVDCTFNGWKRPTKSWVSWVEKLHPSYQFIWKRAGIYDAILSSKYKVVKNEELFIGLAERWCCETNTFVFPWGEATITLEDVMVLGGYSVLGDSVSRSAGVEHFGVIEKKLSEVHRDLSRGAAQKACQGQWMKHFMELGCETGVEHEAFLTYWLSKFVLPTFPNEVIVKRFFRIAIVLAAGVQISLAPVVLASIYRDLTLLKSALVNCSSRGADDGFDDLVKVTVWAPLQLVQVWAWERFPEFRPNPGLIEYGEPRLARWHNVKKIESGNVRPLLQSAGHSFEWRPYCKSVENLPLPFMYRESEEWVTMQDVLGDDIKSLVRFLRVCELVGMDTIEQYNPNRVAMQFGFDQDVPECVKRGLMDSDITKRELVQLAWFSYINPTRDEILYVPSKSYEPQVTTRYLKWLREGVLTRDATIDGVVRKKRSSNRSRRSKELKKVKNAIDKSIEVLDVDVKPKFLSNVIGNDLEVPPGFPPKSSAPSKEIDAYLLPGITQKGNVGQDVDVSPGFMPKNIDNKLDVTPGFIPNTICSVLDVPPGFPQESGVVGKDIDVPPGFTPKNNVGHNVDVPPGFLPRTMGSNHDFPTGFPRKSYWQTRMHVEKRDGCGLKPEVVVKKECIESNENWQPLLRCGHQTLYASPAEIGSRGEELLKTKARESSVKSEQLVRGVKQRNEGVYGKVAQNVDLKRDDQAMLTLQERILRLQKTIAELSEAKTRLSNQSCLSIITAEEQIHTSRSNFLALKGMEAPDHACLRFCFSRVACSMVTRNQKEKEVSELKKAVQSELLIAAKDPKERLILIDAIQRLGVAYHFEEEIETNLQEFYKSYDDDCYNKDDLHYASLLFRLLRQHGFRVSCDVFEKFKLENGSFRNSLTSDVQGILNLYEASQLRVRGEEVLDEALAFTKTHLTSLASSLSSPLAEHITHALKRPLYFCTTRLEAKHHQFSRYESDTSHHEALLRLAKIDFNLLQQLHKQELSGLIRWSRSLDFSGKFPFARDRVVEAYIWSLGVYYEPKYSFARNLVNKVFKLISVIDDMYDAYGTIEELEPFTEAILRWDISCMNELPDYMKPIYQIVLDTFQEFEQVLANEGRSYAVYYLREEVKVSCQAYLQEARWCHEKYVPKFDEYMKNGRVSSVYCLMFMASYQGMGEIATRDAMEWVRQNSKAMKASCVIARLLDDLGGHKFERERNHVASAVECYMASFDVSEEDAYKELQRQVDEAWKDVKAEMLRPTPVPMPLLTRILNMSRALYDVFQNDDDGYTMISKNMEDRIKALLLDTAI